MRKLIILLALAFSVTVSAQVKGDWYIGTGDVANVAWTDWSIAPTVGYGFTDNLMVGLNVSQADSADDMKFDVHARYFFGEKKFFGYAAVEDFDTDLLKVGVGKMFTFHKNVFIDPKVVYDVNAKTTNLSLGFGLKF
jgi:hypothetical protein|tara:strand:- start:307 stop:717 length:411 start_codon:yes stop_codon:yes gene_type:complete